MRYKDPRFRFSEQTVPARRRIVAGIELKVVPTRPRGVDFISLIAAFAASFTGTLAVAQAAPSVEMVSQRLRWNSPVSRLEAAVSDEFQDAVTKPLRAPFQRIADALD